MSLQKQPEQHNNNEDGLNSGPIPNLIPPGLEEIKKIGLTPTEKRAIFFSIKQKIFNKKIRRYVL